MTPTALVVGIGNRDRGDDGVGPEVAARVAGLGLDAVRVVVEDTPLALLDHLAGEDDVVVVDATRPRGRPGTVSVHPVGPRPLPRPTKPVGSHGLGVAEAVEIARATGRLPHRLTLVGVEALSAGPGSGLSEAVRDRLDEAVRAVAAAVRGN